MRVHPLPSDAGDKSSLEEPPLPPRRRRGSCCRRLQIPVGKRASRWEWRVHVGDGRAGWVQLKLDVRVRSADAKRGTGRFMRLIASQRAEWEWNYEGHTLLGRVRLQIEPSNANIQRCVSPRTT